MEQNPHEPGSTNLSAAEMDQLQERANELNVDTFEQRIERIAESDAELASDLGMTVRIAEAAKVLGGEALVVGGFARDDALSRITGQPIESKDIDVEVYGLEFEAIRDLLQGFGELNIVGDHFAVLKVSNPETGHHLDFSMPRRDSKTGQGHKGFEVMGDPHMSVHEAARRRDFTINSLALNPRTGELHDEFGGLDDLKHGVLKATDADLFADDPLRVLRAMQFAGRFGLAIDPDTLDLCRSIDLSSLPRERVGEEWDKLMLKSLRPSVGLEAARQMGILHKLHPELAILDTIEQEPEWHPEGNVWIHTKNAADAAARVVREEGLDGDEAKVVLYGALTHDLGKATTTELKPKGGIMRLTAHGHEQAGVEPARRFLEQIDQKKEVIAKILPVVREHLFHVHAPNPSDPALRRFAKRLAPANVRLYDLVSRCDSNGRGLEWSAITDSYAVYERAQHLNVDEKPLEVVVQGRHLSEAFGLKPGITMGRMVEAMYDLQIEGAFSDIEGGLVYLREHEEEIRQDVQKREAAYLAAKKAGRLERLEKAAIMKDEARVKRQEIHQRRLTETEPRWANKR